MPQDCNKDHEGRGGCRKRSPHQQAPAVRARDLCARGRSYAHRAVTFRRKPPAVAQRCGTLGVGLLKRRAHRVAHPWRRGQQRGFQHLLERALLVQKLAARRASGDMLLGSALLLGVELMIGVR